MFFQGIDRVVIAVKDLKKAIKLFSELLDVEFDVFPRSEELGMQGAYSASGLELIEANGPNTMVGKFLEERGEGLWCVVFKVKDIDEAIKRFEAKGLKLVGEMSFGTMREASFHPKDSFGVQLFLAEYPDIHPATAAAMNFKGQPKE